MLQPRATSSSFINATKRRKAIVYVRGIEDSHRSYWGWADYIFLVFDDGIRQVPEILKPEQVEPTTNKALYSHHEGPNGTDEGAKNNIPAQVEGDDGNIWYKYEKAVPSGLIKSHLKISLVVLAYNWNSWGLSYYNEIGAYFDKVSLE